MPKVIDDAIGIKVKGRKGEIGTWTGACDTSLPPFRIMKKVVTDFSNGVLPPDEAVHVRKFLLDGGDVFADRPAWSGGFLTKNFTDSPLGCGVAFPTAKTIALELEFLADADFKALFLVKRLK